MSHLPPSLVFQHLLFLFLLLIAPVWDWPLMRRLKREPSEARKVGCYRFLCVWLWVATMVAVAVVGWRALFMIDLMPGEIPWLENVSVRYLTEAVIALFIIVTLLPYAIVVWKS